MEVVHSLTMYLDRRRLVPCVDVMQCDADTRVLELTLLAGGEAWDVPSGMGVAVAFRKSDGTAGLYDVLPDGTRACSYSGNVVRAVLAPQVLTAWGKVEVAVVIQDPDTLDRVATFPVCLEVARDPAAGQGISNDHYRCTSLTDVNEILDGFDQELEEFRDSVRPHEWTVNAARVQTNGWSSFLDLTTNRIYRFSYDLPESFGHPVPGKPGTLVSFDASGGDSAWGSVCFYMDRDGGCYIAYVATGGTLEDVRWEKVSVELDRDVVRQIVGGFLADDPPVLDPDGDVLAADNFVDSVSQCTDTSKRYVLPNGDVYAATLLEKGEVAYENLAGDVLENTRMNSSGITKELDGAITTGLIPVTAGQIVRIKGFDPTAIVDGNYPYFHFYTAADESTADTTQTATRGDWLLAGGALVKNGDVYEYTAFKTGGAGSITEHGNSASFTHIRICGAMTGSAADVIVTVDQKIENATDDTYMWKKVGSKFVPADHEKRLEALESKTAGFEETLENVQSGRPWVGKKWVVVGDSLTRAVNSDGSNQNTDKYYHTHIAEETGITVVDMGQAGTGYLRHFDVDAAFFQRIGSVPADADVITIFGSGNDLSSIWNYSGGLGEVTDSFTDEELEAAKTFVEGAVDANGDPDEAALSAADTPYRKLTICGAINRTLDTLFSGIPTANLGIITPTPWKHYHPRATTEEGLRMDLLSEKLVEICRLRSIPCLDLYHCSGLRPWDDAFREEYYSKDNRDSNGELGGVHLDEDGHKIIATKIRAFLETLL